MNLSPFLRFIAVFAFISALSGILAFVSGNQQERAGKAGVTEKRLYPGFTKDEIREIGIITREDTYRLAHTPAGWVMPERADFPVRPEAVSALLEDLQQARQIAPRTKLDARLDALGLGDPEAGRTGAKLSFTGGRSVILGVKAGRQYARWSDDPQSWLVDRSFPPFHRAAWWLDLAHITIPDGVIEQISVHLQKGADYTLIRSGKTFRLESEARAPSAADPDLADALMESSKSLRFLDVQEKMIGLDPIGTQTLVFSDGGQLTLDVFRLNGSYWVEISSDKGTARSEMTDGRWFRTDPISASELIPSPDQW